MRTRFHRMIALLSFLFGSGCLLWGVGTAFALRPTPSPEDDAPYFDAPSLLEILGVDGIEVRWSRLAVAFAGALVLWILFRVISRLSHEAA